MTKVSARRYAAEDVMPNKKKPGPNGTTRDHGDAITASYLRGERPTYIAKQYGVSRATIYKIINRPRNNLDDEVVAMKEIIKVLTGLDRAAKGRVLSYIIARFNEHQVVV